MNILEPGDYVSGVGIVDTVHCGLPWIPTIEGESLYGVVSVVVTENFSKWSDPEYNHSPLGYMIYCDAKTGKAIKIKDVTDRIGDESFDYNNRAKENNGRRYPKELPVEYLREMNWIQSFLYKLALKVGVDFSKHNKQN